MFDAARLRRMKKTAYLVNTARGGIVDEMALHATLTSGTIAGAGIDVFDPEPPSADHPLLKLANFVTSPHMAGVTPSLDTHPWVGEDYLSRKPGAARQGGRTICRKVGFLHAAAPVFSDGLLIAIGIKAITIRTMQIR